MARLLFVLLIALGVYLIVRALRGENRSRPDGKIDAKTLDQCAQCGTFLPTEDAVQHRGKRFCCTTHRDEYDRANDRP